MSHNVPANQFNDIKANQDFDPSLPIIATKGLYPPHNLGQRPYFLNEAGPSYERLGEKQREISIKLGQVAVGSLVKVGEFGREIGSQISQAANKVGNKVENKTKAGIETAKGTMLEARIKIAENRHSRAEKLSDKLELRKKVIEETTQAALEGRDPKPKLRPVTRRQNRLAQKASRKSEKALRQSFEQTRIAKVYGAPRGTRGPLFERTVAPTTDGKRLGIRRSDIGTPDQEARLQSERLSRHEEKSERKSTKRWRKAGRKHEDHLDAIKSQRDGTDLRGRIDERRRQRADRRAQEQADLVEDLKVKRV